MVPFWVGFFCALVGIWVGEQAVSYHLGFSESRGINDAISFVVAWVLGAGVFAYVGFHVARRLLRGASRAA